MRICKIFGIIIIYPEEAYEFGEKIKKLVRDENLSGLFDLVERRTLKDFVKGKNFRYFFR